MRLRIKIFIFSGIFSILLLFSCFVLSVSAETYGDDDWDTSVYDCSWSLGASNHWIYQFRAGWNPLSWGYAFGAEHTTVYLRITDEKTGTLVTNITRIQATYLVNGKTRKNVKEKLDYNYLDKAGIWELGDNGKITSYDYFWANIDYSTTVFKHEKLSSIFDNYEECNYIWEFDAKVTKFETLYVWYIDPSSGKEVASSMYDDGAHPRYDDKGNFIGIYNANNELMDGYSLSENGLLLSPEKHEIFLTDEQTKGVKVGSGDVSNPFSLFSDGNTSIINKIINGVVLIVEIFIAIVLIYYLFRLFKFIFKLLK